jgi:gamma-glutamylcyclotransferase (GGCT)/AIG2-like uncharacterized protein YtfP
VLNLLFVYGTLRRAFDNEHARLLRNEAEFVGEAQAPGRIYRIGWYPGFVCADDKAEAENGFVRGELYRLRDPERTLARLDEYEGDDFERVETEAQGAPAWIYRIRRVPEDAEAIESGDFCSK